MIAIYARISGVKEDDTDKSIDFQVTEGVKFANDRNIDYRIYKDEGISGTTDPEDRAGMTRLLMDIINGEITHLYAWHQYRLYRSDTARVKIQTVCRKHKVRIFYDREEFLYDDPTSRMIDSIITATGQFYVDLTKAHVKGVIKKNFEEGKAHGRTPFGYDTDKDKTLIPHAVNADIAKNIFKWSANGDTSKVIIDRLNAQGIKTSMGRRWIKATVLKMLHNPLYYGQRKYHDTFVPCPAIIDKSLFDRSLEAIQSNYIDRGARDITRFWLNDLIDCNNCKGRYLGTKIKVHAYHCKTKKNFKTCNSSNVNADFLEGFIWYILVNDFPIKVQEYSLTENKDEERCVNRIASLRGNLSDLDKELTKQAEIAVKGILPLDKLEALSKRIQSDQKRIEKQLRELQDKLKTFENPDLGDITSATNSIALSNGLKKQVARKFILKVEVFGVSRPVRIDVHFRVMGIRMSYFIDTKKGFVMDRLDNNLYINGEGYIKLFKDSSNANKWFQSVPFLKKIHQQILDSGEYKTNDKVNRNTAVY